jgi:hypothetical protein
LLTPGDDEPLCLLYDEGGLLLGLAEVPELPGCGSAVLLMVEAGAWVPCDAPEFEGVTLAGLPVEGLVYTGCDCAGDSPVELLIMEVPFDASSEDPVADEGAVTLVVPPLLMSVEVPLSWLAGEALLVLVVPVLSVP